MASSSVAGLVVLPDPTGLTMTWTANAGVDGWVAYCDPQDGSDLEQAWVTEPRHRFGDLAPGPHLLGVTAWLRGEPVDPRGVWTEGAVPESPPGSPNVPVVVSAAVSGEGVAVSWISQDAEDWHVRLVDDDGRVLRRRRVDYRAAGADRTAVFGTVDASGRVAAQVQAVGGQVGAGGGARVLSAWSEPVWVDLRSPGA